MIYIVFIKELFIRIASFFIKDKNKRKKFRKNAIMKVERKYLERYLYSIANFDDVNETNKKDTIWVCWFQGEEKAPEVVKKCLETICKNARGLNVVVLDNTNLGDYCKLPDYIYEKQAKGLITPMQFSDIIRATLLTDHGGIWIDATVFLSAELPEYFLSNDFFCLQSDGLYKNVNWFIAANQGNKLIAAQKKYMYEYWRQENKLINYFFYPLLFDFLIANSDVLQERWQKIPKVLEDDCYQIQNNLLHQFDDKMWKRYVSQTAIHKLTYKYDKSKNISGTFLENFLNFTL